MRRKTLFSKLPIHWMWWPAIGGLAIGIGGLIFPQALGVGYDTIGGLLQGNVAIQVILGVLLVKSVYLGGLAGFRNVRRRTGAAADDGWGTGRAGSDVPAAEGAGFWPLISMGAILGGTMRSPLTGIVFAFELTHDVNIVSAVAGCEL